MWVGEAIAGRDEENGQVEEWVEGKEKRKEE